MDTSWDDDGIPIANGVDPALATFLQTDVQGSVEAAQSLLAQIVSPADAEITGNAHTLYLDGDHVRIESLFDEEAAPYSTDRRSMENILTAWLEFIRSSAAE